MAHVPVFHGRVADDGLTVQFDEAEREARRAHLSKLAGKRVDVVVKVHRNQRTLDQNAWHWGVAIPIIAEELGYDKDEHDTLHYALVDLCFGTKFDQRSGLTVPNVRSSLTDTAQFAEFMEWLVRWAAREHGIVVPLPREVEVA